MSLLTTLISQLAPTNSKRTGADRQREHRARMVALHGIDAVRAKEQEKYYRNRESILARKRARKAGRLGEMARIAK